MEVIKVDSLEEEIVKLLPPQMKDRIEMPAI